jgi:hypothetical protein
MGEVTDDTTDKPRPAIASAFDLAIMEGTIPDILRLGLQCRHVLGPREPELTFARCVTEHDADDSSCACFSNSTNFKHDRVHHAGASADAEDGTSKYGSDPSRFADLAKRDSESNCCKGSAGSTACWNSTGCICS